MLAFLKKAIATVLVVCSMTFAWPTVKIQETPVSPETPEITRPEIVIVTEDSDIDLIADNLVQGLVSGTIAPFTASDIQDAGVIMSLIAADKNGNYYFTDIDYSNGDTVNWPAAKHLTRTEYLAMLYRQTQNEALKAQYKDCILKLIDHWTEGNYENSNWWHNWLSIPNIAGEIGLLMKDDLGKNRLIQLADVVGLGCFTINPLIYTHVGSNAADLAMSSIKFGVLTDNPKVIRTAVSEVNSALDYSLLEGIKQDGSYFQHGTRLYMGGYGIEFIKGMSSIMAMLSGTEYTFTEEQLKPFAGFILEGLRGMSFGSTLDPVSMGRSVSRINAQPLKGIVPALQKLASIPEMPRADEILAYAQSIAADSKSNNGVKFYDNAKLLVINNSDFYFSFRGGDSTLMYAEQMNDENILCYNSTYPGTTTVMSSGREHLDISPLYDFAMIPGTTAVHESDEQLRKHLDLTYRPLVGIYGDASAEGAAAALVKTTHEGISMTVSCFATDNAAIILGAGMNDLQGRSMITTLDQSYFTGSYVQDGSTVIHNGIKYTVYEGGELNASAEHRQGNWRRNNLTYPDAYVEGDIFTLSMANSGSYAYSVMSQNSDAEFEVIENSSCLQAVRLPDGRIAASFIGCTSFTYDGVSYCGMLGQVKIFG